MGSDAIKSLKSSLADLTYILFTIGKEFDLIIKQTEDNRINEDLRQVISSLQDSNSEVIRLYHEIQSNEADLQNKWYDNKEDINNLQNTIENLLQSTEALIIGNQQFLNNTYTS